jgi:hypothetical protein
MLIVILLLTILVSAVVTFVLSSMLNPAISNTNRIYPGAPTYTVWTKNDLYYAEKANGEQPSWGKGTTNASYLFTLMINSLPKQGGQIYVSAGTYVFDSTIIIARDSVAIQGEGIGMHKFGEEGEGITKFKVTTNVNPMFLVYNESDSQLTGISFSDLYFYGNGRGNSSQGIQLVKTDFTLVQRCTFQEFGDAGVWQNSGEATVFAECAFWWNNVGLQLRGAFLKVYACEISDNFVYGVDLGAGGPCLRSRIINNGIANDGTAVNIRAGSNDNIIALNNFNNNSVSNITDAGSNNIVEYNQGS